MSYLSLSLSVAPDNGADGLVAARHLTQFGYHVDVHYPRVKLEVRLNQSINRTISLRLCCEIMAHGCNRRDVALCGAMQAVRHCVPRRDAVGRRDRAAILAGARCGVWVQLLWQSTSTVRHDPRTNGSLASIESDLGRYSKWLGCREGRHQWSGSHACDAGCVRCLALPCLIARVWLIIGDST